MGYRNTVVPFSVERPNIRQKLVVLTRRSMASQIVGEETPFTFVPQHRDQLGPTDEELFQDINAAVQRIVSAAPFLGKGKAVEFDEDDVY